MTFASKHYREVYAELAEPGDGPRARSWVRIEAWTTARDRVAHALASNAVVAREVGALCDHDPDEVEQLPAHQPSGWTFCEADSSRWGARNDAPR